LQTGIIDDNKNEPNYSSNVYTIGITMKFKILKATFAGLVLTVSGFANSALIIFTGTIESWTVASSGTYSITAIGAQGASAQSGRVGGRGASMSGLFDLLAGDLYFFAVGGAGTASSANGAGGGGSFFVDALNNPLLVAGGGGGTRIQVSQNGCDALTTSFGGFGSAGSTTSSCGSKTSGLGQGGIISSGSWGSAGAGFFSDGAVEYASGVSAKSWLNGLNGGAGSCGGSVGGFGGGGTGAGCNGGGGGGGYSGGDGGRVAGGGGSFNTGNAQINIAGVGLGNGSIEWTLVSVPEPSALAIFALGIMGLASRRLKKQ
jgi:hypothetical protein